jgi:hypothetical protein
MRRLAIAVAGMGFFALAIVGGMSGQSVLTCGVRAVIGAAVLFVVVTMGGRIALNIIVDGLLKSRFRGGTAGEDQDQLNNV